MEARAGLAAYSRSNIANRPNPDLEPTNQTPNFLSFVLILEEAEFPPFKTCSFVGVPRRHCACPANGSTNEPRRAARFVHGEGPRAASPRRAPAPSFC